jgi:hypothetical protein
VIVTWVFNFFLWYLGQSNPAIWAQLIAKGTTFYTCEQIGAGRAPVISDACIGPAPTVK